MQPCRGHARTVGRQEEAVGGDDEHVERRSRAPRARASASAASPAAARRSRAARASALTGDGCELQPASLRPIGLGQHQRNRQSPRRGSRRAPSPRTPASRRTTVRRHQPASRCFLRSPRREPRPLQRRQVVDEDLADQVVHFVLDAHGEQAVGVELERLAVLVQRAHADASRRASPCRSSPGTDRQPSSHSASPSAARISGLMKTRSVVARLGDVDHDDALVHVDLGRREADARAPRTWSRPCRGPACWISGVTAATGAAILRSRGSGILENRAAGPWVQGRRRRRGRPVSVTAGRHLGRPTGDFWRRQLAKCRLGMQNPP